MSRLGFDLDKEQDPENFEPIPNGKYNVTVTAIEEKIPKSGEGQYLKLTLTVLDGAHKGRKVWDNLNIHHSSAKAQQIARSALKGLVKAALLNPATFTEPMTLIGKTVNAKVILEEGTNGYNDQNRIMGYEPFRAGAQSVVTGTPVGASGSFTTPNDRAAQSADVPF